MRLARLIFSLSFFLLIERVTALSRVAGAAGVVYATNPNFVFWSQSSPTSRSRCPSRCSPAPFSLWCTRARGAPWPSGAELAGRAMRFLGSEWVDDHRVPARSGNGDHTHLTSYAFFAWFSLCSGLQAASSHRCVVTCLICALAHRRLRLRGHGLLGRKKGGPRHRSLPAPGAWFGLPRDGFDDSWTHQHSRAVRRKHRGGGPGHGCALLAASDRARIRWSDRRCGPVRAPRGARALPEQRCRARVGGRASPISPCFRRV